MVAEYLKINFNVTVEERQIIPGYIQDKAKMRLRQPVWKVVVSKDAILFIALMKDKVEDIEDFHPGRVGDGYALPNNLGFIYLSEITKENSKYSRGLCKGVRYYDLNVHVPGR